MDSQTGERAPVRVGRTATAAAVAGLLGLVVTLAVASSLFIGGVLGRSNPALAPGYEDYGQRHRADYADAKGGSPGRLDDYGLRCIEVGWCSMPDGVPQPARIDSRD